MLLAMLLDPQLLHLDDREYSFILAMVQGCTQRLESMSERSEVCAKASPMLRRILGKVEQYHARGGIMSRNGHIMPEVSPVGGGGMPNLMASSSVTPPMHDPTSAVDLHGWTMRPELNAIMSHLPPEQWLAPSAFNWNCCWNPEVVQTSPMASNPWGG